MEEPEFEIVVGHVLPEYHCHLSPKPMCDEFQWVDQAELYWRSGERQLELRGSYFWVNRAHQRIQYGPLDDAGRWHHRYLVMRGRRCKVWREMQLLPEEPQKMASEWKAEWAQGFDEVLTLSRSSDPLAMMRAAHRLEAMLLTFARSASSQREMPSWLEDCLLALDGSGATLPNYAALASHYGVSLRSLQRHFKQHYGITPHQYHMQSKVEEVKKSLIFSRKPLAELADRFGYSDTFHLIRTFKRFTGMSPGDFRKKMPTVPRDDHQLWPWNEDLV